ncbi:MAG: CbtA family protein [Rhodospirillales bacterium]|nr:CbtA family protein [Rhodospirillales bacterium]
MFKRILFIALVAGALGGLVTTGLQMAHLWPLILEAEKYETAAPAHDHVAASQPATAPEAAAWKPDDGAERMGFTLLFNVLTGFGFALLLNAALVLRRAASADAALDAGNGALWGLAGFAVFAFVPALGLPPELPGMQAAELVDRQVWWLATVIATAAGLWLLIFGRGTLLGTAALKALGLLLLVLPHAIGAPHPVLDSAAGPRVPAELAARFAIASLVAAAAFWLVVGAASGWLQRRADRAI